MQNQPRALHMAQKVMPQPHTVGGALDQARDIRHDEALLIVRLDNAEDRRNRRKMVVCNLGTCRRAGGNKTRLPDTRIADQPNIGEQLQLKTKLSSLARLAELSKGRCTVGRVGKLGIPAPTAPAACNHRLHPDFREVGKHLSRRLIRHNRAGRDIDIEGRRIFSELVLVLTILAVLRDELAAIAKGEQRIQIAVGTKDYITAASAVTARRAALGHKLFMTERGLSMTAVPRLHRDLGTIDKLHTSLPLYTISCSRKCTPTCENSF